MSGQFEQRRLARPSYQLEVLDRFCGDEQVERRAAARAAWRDLLAARRRLEELTADAGSASARRDELLALVEDTTGMEPGAEDGLRADRERLRHVSELAEAASAAAAALTPDDGEGAAGLVALAERSVAPLERLAPELQRAGDELRDVELRLRETASELHSFLASLEAEPGRLELLEASLDRIAEPKRRFRCQSYEELLGKAAEARAELAALEEGTDPAAAAAEALQAAEALLLAIVSDLRAERKAAAPAFGDAVASELRDVGMADGEFRCELRDVELRLRETASELSSFLASLEAEPGRLAELEAMLDRIAEAKRRFRCQTYDELLGRAAEARAELAALEDGAYPTAAMEEAVHEAETRIHALALELRAERNAAAPAFADAVASELHDVGMGDGEFVCELAEREPGATGADDALFLVRPNAGLPFAPVAETASGGELSRIALAIAAVAGGETLVFDEIDAGIGGETANAVGRVLQRLAERAQVITITHLPQIAALADRHFRVEKVPGDPTHTQITALADDERKAELERMLGGEGFLATVRG